MLELPSKFLVVLHVSTKGNNVDMKSFPLGIYCC